MYEEHFGLSRKPFQLSPDADFYFPSAEHNKALSYLQYGLNQADGFIVITGNVGTGKTTLVETLLSQLNDTNLKVVHIVSSNLENHDLLQMVANQLDANIGEQSKASLLRELERLFEQRSQANERILLIVDEAQNLPPDSIEELRMLSNFQKNGKPVVQIFLLGQQEFRGTLLSRGFEQLRQRVIATYHLNPLDEGETKTYIEHRLTVAGWQNTPRFSEEAYSAIFTFCEGVPRRINNLCDRILLYTFLEEIELIDQSTVDTVANEIGQEFLGGSGTEQGALEPADDEAPETAGLFDSPLPPQASAARGMFDKADVHNRFNTLERAVDGLGHNLKSEIVQIKEELSFLRLMVDDVLYEVRSRPDGAPIVNKKGA